MKKLLIIAGITLLLMALGLGVLFYSVKSYLKPERVSALLSKRIEASLHHKVRLGPVSTGFSSARVQGFTLLPNDPEEKTPLISVKEVTVSFSLLPLLKKKLNIRKIVIDSPIFTLTREKDGTLNWESEFKKTAFNRWEWGNSVIGTGLSLVPTAHAAEKPDPAPMGFTIEVGKVEIHKGTIVWIDRSLTPLYKATFSSVALELEDLSWNHPFDFELKGLLKRDGETHLTAKGIFNLRNKNLKGHLTLNPVFLPDVNPYLARKGIEILKGVGKLDLEISARKFRTWNVEPDIVLKGVGIRVRGKSLRPIQANLTGKIGLDLDGDTLSIHNLAGKVMDSDFKLNGNIQKLHTVPTGSLQFVSKKMDIDTLMGLTGIAQEASIKPKTPSTPRKGARGPQPSLKKPASNKKAPPSLPFLTIQVKIHLLIIKKVKVQDIDTKVVTRAHDAMLNPFTAKIYGGTVKGNMDIDLSSGAPVIREHVSAGDVDIAPLLLDMNPGMKERFTGLFSGETRGRGIIGAPSTIKGEATFHVEKGSIQHMALLKVLAVIMKLPSLANLRFDVLRGNARVHNQQVQIVKAEARGKDLLFDTQGTIGFNKKLTLNARLELPYRVIRKGLGKRSELFADRVDARKRRWSIIPIRIRGTTEHPLVTVKFEKRAIEKIIEKNIHDKKIKNFLKKLFR